MSQLIFVCPSVLHMEIKIAKRLFQAKGNKFEKLSGKEKRTLLARILEEEFVNPIQVIIKKPVIIIANQF